MPLNLLSFLTTHTLTEMELINLKTCLFMLDDKYAGVTGMGKAVTQSSAATVMPF